MTTETQKHILITGGAGFIGSHLTERLLKEGNRVYCLDSFFSGKKENIEMHLGNPNFTLIRHDVREPLKFHFSKLDRIYHLACPASPVQYQFDPVLTMETSILGTQHMLSLARKMGARLLYSSTSEVYGDPLEHPQKETYWGNVDPLGKRACYDEGKRAAEALCKDYHEQFGVEVRLIRIFNTYGPRMMFNDGRVLSNFVLQALLGEDITVHGNGLQTRSFCYVDDLVEGMIRRMEVENDWLPVNLGNPDERSMKDLALMVKEKIASKSELIFLDESEIPSRAGDPKQRCPDISRAKSLLSWEPKIGFEEGLSRTIADFQKRLAHKPHVAVFVPVYGKKNGPAEETMEQVIKRMQGYEFDIFTARMDANVPAESHSDGVHVYRLGTGKNYDKYLLPIRAALLARKMNKKYDYKISWAIMASYGAMAATFFSWLVRGKMPFLLSVYEGNVTKKIQETGRFKFGLYRMIFHSAARWQFLVELDEQTRMLIEEETKIQIVKDAQNFDLLAKKTKEILQDIEILSTRV